MSASATATPPATKAARPTKALPHIPLEILQKIAEHLDLPSAVTLSRTCKALRDAGEVRVWHSVDISSLWDSANPASAEIVSVDDYRTRQETVERKLANVLSAIEAYPFRRECIVRLRVEQSDGPENQPIAPRLMRLLDMVAERVQSLSFLPLPNEDAWTASELAQFGHIGFTRLLTTSPLDFPKVGHFRYACGNQAINSLGNVMNRVRNVHELEFCSAEECYEMEINDDVIWSPSLHLKRITFNHVDDTESPLSTRILARLLEHAPNLEYLRMLGQWAPRRRDPALQAMEKLKKLRTVIALDEDGIETERFGKVGLVVEETVVEDDSLDETNELTFENIILAKMPNLHRVTILTSPRLPLVDYVALSLGKTPYETGHLSSIFIRYIRRVPLLSVVLFHWLDEPFPSAYNTTYIEPEYFVNPERWEAEGHRGAIIRQYLPSSGGYGRAGVAGDAHVPPGECFLHIRSLSRSLDHPTGPAYVGARRCWRDFTHYRGRTVPRAVLDQTYATAGLHPEFLSGGRSLTLGDEGDGSSAAAWRILRDWRDTAGDESEVEDDFSDEDGLDEDYESEDDDDDDDLGDDSDDGHGGLVGMMQMMDVYGDAGIGTGHGDDDGWEDMDDDEDEGSDGDDPISYW